MLFLAGMMSFNSLLERLTLASIFCLQLCDALKVLFPKLGDVTGGWLLYKSAGRVTQVDSCSLIKKTVHMWQLTSHYAMHNTGT